MVSEATVVKARGVEPIFRYGENVPYDEKYRHWFADCPIPGGSDGDFPLFVSLVERPCDNATNAVLVVNNRLGEGRSRRTLAVCVKGISFPFSDWSLRLAEWIELKKAMGADVFVYTYNDNHPNVTTVLEHYAKKGTINLREISLAGFMPNAGPHRYFFFKRRPLRTMLMDQIPYHDCLYRNRHLYHFVSFLDIDEVIMTEHENYADLVHQIIRDNAQPGSKIYDFYSFSTVQFFDQVLQNAQTETIPLWLYTMRHTKRSARFYLPGARAKCLYNASSVVRAHNHGALECAGHPCAAYYISRDYGQNSHYRVGNCPDDTSQAMCDMFKKEMVEDSRARRYYQPVLRGVTETKRILKL